MKHIYTIDLNQDKSKINPYLSNTLLSHMEKAFLQKEKVLLYLNKRGAYDMLICQDCNFLKKCPKCDLALSIHKRPEALFCHHCGYSEEIPLACSECGSVSLKNVGVGTQQIEATLQKIFPNKKIYRLDSDNVKNIGEKKLALENIQNSDIIVGTKMITTGFDLRNVGVIGVILLEQELHIPRYDTEEKIYQNIKQLIGRGGRVGQETQIILQSYMLQNEMMKNITDLNYKDFFLKTLQERKLFSYPPFLQMATLRYKHQIEEKSLHFTKKLYEKLCAFENDSYQIILLPNAYKRDNQYFSKIIIKGANICDFLQNIKKDILSNKDLIVIFE